MKFKTITQEIKSCTPADLTLHALVSKTPKMTAENYNSVKRDIEMNGQKDPVIVYRGKIIDGRHRWLMLQELGVDIIYYVELPNNTTLKELKATVFSKEFRRHESPAQLAISAYYELTSEDSDYKTLADVADVFGIPRPRVSEVKQIAVTYGRMDILTTIFNGDRFDVGTPYKPKYTDSLPAILNWLRENSSPTVQSKKDIGIKPRKELTSDEQMLVTTFLAAVAKESVFVQEAIADAMYTKLKEIRPELTDSAIREV